MPEMSRAGGTATTDDRCLPRPSLEPDGVDQGLDRLSSFCSVATPGGTVVELYHRLVAWRLPV
jgi:hypothetical protein